MVKDVENVSKEKMQKTLDAFVNDLSTLKAGRANPHMLDKISVDYYGAATPLSQVAAISSPEPRILLVQPWMRPSESNRKGELWHPIWD
jgi:ribosome recycling factor